MRNSPLSLALAAGACLPATLNDAKVSIESQMKRWEIEDNSNSSSYTIKIEPRPEECRWNTVQWDSGQAIMQSMKNISPNRVRDRRRKNKAARKSRRANR